MELWNHLQVAILADFTKFLGKSSNFHELSDLGVWLDDAFEVVLNRTGCREAALLTGSSLLDAASLLSCMFVLGAGDCCKIAIFFSHLCHFSIIVIFPSG